MSESPQVWRDVDTYFEDRLVRANPRIAEIPDRSRRAGLPDIAVSACQGKFLCLLVQMNLAKRVLEVGTLGGYSAAWIASGLPSDTDAGLVTLELDPRNAEVASQNLAYAGLAERVEIRVGPALDAMAAMLPSQAGSFDLVFIDADKPNNPGYIRAAAQLARPGGVIVLDNVVRRGNVIDRDAADASVLGTRSAIELIRDTPGLSATALQTVGAKGYDGFLIAVVSEQPR